MSHLIGAADLQGLVQGIKRPVAHGIVEGVHCGIGAALRESQVSGDGAGKNCSREMAPWVRGGRELKVAARVRRAFVAQTHGRRRSTPLHLQWS